MLEYEIVIVLLKRRLDKMAKKDVCVPNKCKPFLAIILIVGILYLLKDLAVADWTFGIQWFTVLFVLIGLHAFICKSCK